MTYDGIVSPTWNALENEAEVAAEHFAIGATALGRANYAQPAYYGQAFFALSVGLERSAKLALLLDHIADTGAFPTNQHLRNYSHDIAGLLNDLNVIARRRRLPILDATFPLGPVADAVVDVLTKFANNTTRYYNLDLVTAANRIAGHDDPIAEWWNRVVSPIIQTLPAKSIERVTTRAREGTPNFEFLIRQGIRMRTILNLIWIVFSGIWLALGYTLAGIFMFLLIVTIPFGFASFHLAAYVLWPFGRTVVKRPTAGAASTIGNVLWFILAGVWMALAHLFLGVLLCLTIVGIPLGLGNFKRPAVALAPLGKEIVSTRDPRAAQGTVSF